MLLVGFIIGLALGIPLLKVMFKHGTWGMLFLLVAGVVAVLVWYGGQ